MKKTVVIVLLATAGVAGLVFAYLKTRQEREQESAADAPVVAPSHLERGDDGANALKLDSDTQKRLGLRTAVPIPGSVTSELMATARVLDGAALATAVREIRSAQIALDAARADYERKKKLFDNGQNAPATAVEQAEALAKQQQVAVESSRDRIAATWGQAVAAREDLPAFAHLLLRREAALVRVELLATDRLASPPQTLRLFQQNGETAGVAQILGPAPATDSGVAGQGFLCLLTTNATHLVSGSVLLARLDTGRTEQGIVLPRGAVVRHAGLGWAYAQTGADSFARRVVPLDHPHPDGWLVPGEWTQPVVVAGAQSLLSEELKGSIQMKE